jgi:hypothetical protein
VTARRALVAAGLIGVAGTFVVLPGGASVPADVQVVDSHAAAAVLGVVSRVPAETAGGLIYTGTAITLDKAIARAAGFTAGPLAETFIESSSDEYRNSSMVTAQYPPTDAFPAEASSGQETPEGAPIAGRLGRFHARAAADPAVAAEATGADAAAGEIKVAQATATSRSELRPDGTLVTRAVSVAAGIRIAEVVTATYASTTAETVVPPSGPPATRLEVDVAGLLVGGVPARISDRGLRIGDQTPVGPAELARFNTALAALQAQGISITAVPTVREGLATTARAEGAALRVRYSVAPQIGGDEEFLLAQATASSTVVRRAPLLPVLPPGLDANPGFPAEETLPSPEAGPVPPAAALTPGPVPAAGFSSLPAPLPAETAPAPLPGAAPAATEVASPVPDPAGINLLGARDDPSVTRLRSGYGVFVLVAVGAAGLFVARSRTRLQ